MYGVDICCPGSDLVFSQEETPSSAQQEVGGDDNNFAPRGMLSQSLRVDADGGGAFDMLYEQQQQQQKMMA